MYAFDTYPRKLEVEVKGTNISGMEEHISVKYEIKKRIGKGAYGIVWKAVDRESGEVLAVKKIFDAFRNRTDAQRTFREIMFLQAFGDHTNIVKLLNVIRAQNDKDIYLIFEYMDTDLHAVIKKGNLLKDIHKRYVMYQLLKATKYLHSGNVIHRDQKPSNILLNADCLVKLCDFGLTRSLYQIQEDAGNPALTEYVATRWYRAPEILLGSTRYTKGVDMWGIGCILAEMLLGKALFPGTSTINQIEKIITAIPHPSSEDILSIKSEYGASVIQKMLLKPQVPLEDLLEQTVPSDALDLLSRLLVFNPDNRLTAEQALQHPYVARFHNPAKEPALDYDVVLQVDDDVQLSVLQYRNKLYEMMLEKRTNQRMPRLIQPKQRERTDSESSESGPRSAHENGDCVNTKDTPKEKETGEQDPFTVNGDCGDHDGKIKKDRVEHTRHLPTRTVITNVGSGKVPIHPTVEKTSLVMGKVTYNPITYVTNGFVQSPTGSAHCQGKKPVRQTGDESVSPIEDANANTNQRSRSQVRDAPPPPRFSKKVFQSSSNVSATGDPRAKLGSYSQAYGTINKTQLDNLLRSHCHKN